jgi:hypothetical protein
MIFKCKACGAKDEHIATLKSQVADLQKLVFAPQAALPSLANTEMNAVLDGQVHAIELDESNMSEAQLKELDDTLREASNILSGNY